MPAVVLTCFFLSGASGLMFELLWTRMLTLVFGSTTLAVSTVLATFMGGLGLGAYIAGRWADRVRDPVRAYAVAEAAIGLYALVVPSVIGLYPDLNRWLWTTLGDRYALLSVVRFGASAALLLLPTTLMGATLPLLARYFVSRPYELRRASLRLGTLYAVNLFGAVAGSFLAGFVFLPSFGVRATNIVAASFNLTLAAGVLLVQRVMGDRSGRRALDDLVAEAAAQGTLPAAETLERHLGPVPVVTPAARKIVLLAFAVSGATAMTLQVLWTRALAVVIGSSIYSFTLILLAFLVGLGSGSAVFGRVAQKSAHPVRWLAVVHLAIAAAVGFSYLLTDKLPFLFAGLLGTTSMSTDAVLACQFALACIAVLPATFLMGAIFPLTVRVVTAEVGSVARDVGSAYAINTIGAITGSFLSGFVVLPMLGLQKGIYLAAVAGLALAALLAAVSPGLAARRRLVGIATAVAMAVGGLALPRWDLTIFSQGFFRVGIARDYLTRKARKQDWATPQLMFYEDGIATTVSVDRWGTTYSMKNNGKVDASSDADMPTQVSVGLLPLLLWPHERAPKVALVGYGSGVTAGSVTQAAIASLEVIELEPAIYRASRFFEHVNHRPLQNPLVTARVGDGRNFLGQRTDRFDIVISQPSNPWITGVSNLFTREYFQEVKARLAEDGIFCQWAQLYEMAPWNVKAIYRTLREEFPHVMVFAAEDLSSDTILIASRRPLRIDRARLARALADGRTGAEARRAGYHTAHDVAAQLLLGPAEVAAFTAGAAINTDDNALIEFAAPRDLLGYAKFDPYLAKVYGPSWPYGRLDDVIDGYDGPEGARERARLAHSLLAHGKRREAASWAARAGAEADEVRVLMELIATREDRDPEIPLAPEGDLAPPETPPGTDPALAERVRREHAEVLRLVQQRRYLAAYTLIDQWPEPLWGKMGPDTTLLMGFLEYKASQWNDAALDLAPLATDAAYVARRPELLYYLGRSQWSNASYGKAIASLERFIQAQRALERPVMPPSPPSPR